MSTFKIKWLHNLYRKTFHKPRLSNKAKQNQNQNPGTDRARGTFLRPADNPNILIKPLGSLGTPRSTTPFKRSVVSPETNTPPPSNNPRADTGSLGTPKVTGTHTRRFFPENNNSPVEPPPLYPVDAKSIFKDIDFKPYSVIGETGKNYSVTKKDNFNYKTPDYVLDINFSQTALVDAGGLPYFIKNPTIIDPTAQKQSTGPKGAGLSSGALYKYIGIDQADDFPDDVTDKITGIGDATFHQYKRGDNKFNVIHAIGPDFRLTPDKLKESISKNEDFKDIKKSAKIDNFTAISILSLLYKNIFITYIKNKNTYNLNTLNIVPISVGQFAHNILKGPHNASIITMVSIFNALNMLNQTNINILEGTKINLCFWNDTTIRKIGVGTDHPLCDTYKRQREHLLNYPVDGLVDSLIKRGGYLKYRSVKNKYSNAFKKRTFRKY
jgi:hypothetical protein